ncbi:MAG TPA: FAD-dependent oxidoreductase [Thermoleophilaceae bacterium]|nr:FAD-dependent oxidoreductase [Thermoleophilaceae bacterium]
MPDLLVAGAGMAGLAAAARARELGGSVQVLEKGDRPGGSMLLSSGFVWRHGSFSDFRAECPGGDEALQRLVFDGLDESLDWLESLGAPVLARETGNPLTCGRRFDTRGLTDALVRASGDVRLGSPLSELPDGVPVLLATGGFQGDPSLVRSHITPEADHVLLRANPWSAGDGLRLGLDAGGSLSAGMGEFYGRNMPAPPARVDAAGFVPLAQLYARFASVVGPTGENFTTSAWSEIDVVQWTARQPGARARYVVPDSALGERVRERTVGDMIESARLAGARVERDGRATSVEVVAAITTTLGGLRVDASGRVADGLFAAGADAGGVSTGGYSSGLAAALVLGRVAAEAALR